MLIRCICFVLLLMPGCNRFLCVAKDITNEVNTCSSSLRWIKQLSFETASLQVTSNSAVINIQIPPGTATPDSTWGAAPDPFSQSPDTLAVHLPAHTTMLSTHGIHGYMGPLGIRGTGAGGMHGIHELPGIHGIHASPQRLHVSCVVTYAVLRGIYTPRKCRDT